VASHALEKVTGAQQAWESMDSVSALPLLDQKVSASRKVRCEGRP